MFGKTNHISINLNHVVYFLRDSVRTLDLSFAQEALLIRIFSRNGINKEYRVTQESLAQDMNCNVSYIRRISKSLIERNFITIKKSGTFNYYSVSEHFKEKVSDNLCSYNKQKSISKCGTILNTPTNEHLNSATIEAVTSDDAIIYNINNINNNINPPISPQHHGDEISVCNELSLSVSSNNYSSKIKFSKLIQSDEIIKIHTEGEGLVVNKEYAEYEEMMANGSFSIYKNNKSNSINHGPYSNFDDSKKMEGEEGFPFLDEFISTFPKPLEPTILTKVKKFWKHHNLENFGKKILDDVINRCINHEPWIRNINNNTTNYLPNAFRYLCEKMWDDPIILQSNNLTGEQHGGNKGSKRGYVSAQAWYGDILAAEYAAALEAERYREAHGLPPIESLPHMDF